MKGRRGSKGGKKGPEGAHRHLIEEMLVVPIADRGRARDVLGGPQEWTDRDLMERLGGLQESDVADIKAVVDIIRVDNAHQRAREVRLNGGVRASPVHELGHLNHSKVMSGDGPYPDDSEVDSQAANSASPVIAVVDSGIVDEAGLPELAEVERQGGRGQPQPVGEQLGGINRGPPGGAQGQMN